ncbi:MAG: hypothetical protein R3Y08_00680 [Rikenellaceae bacterium]
MKKIALTAAIIIAGAATSQAQTFDVGTKNITVTTAIVTGYNIPIAVSYEQGIVDFGGANKLGIGGYLLTGGSYTFIAPECNYHYVGFEQFDLYAGVRFGYCSKNNGGKPYSTANIGANYYFNPSWAINAEVGSGLGWLNLGATFKF